MQRHYSDFCDTSNDPKTLRKLIGDAEFYEEFDIGRNETDLSCAKCNGWAYDGYDDKVCKPSQVEEEEEADADEDDDSDEAEQRRSERADATHHPPCMCVPRSNKPEVSTIEVSSPVGMRTTKTVTDEEGKEVKKEVVPMKDTAGLRSGRVDVETYRDPKDESNVILPLMHYSHAGAKGKFLSQSLVPQPQIAKDSLSEFVNKQMQRMRDSKTEIENMRKKYATKKCSKFSLSDIESDIRWLQKTIMRRDECLASRKSFMKVAPKDDKTTETVLSCLEDQKFVLASLHHDMHLRCPILVSHRQKKIMSRMGGMAADMGNLVGSMDFFGKKKTSEE